MDSVGLPGLMVGSTRESGRMACNTVRENIVERMEFGKKDGGSLVSA
jgi:hypothetical protein